MSMSNPYERVSGFLYISQIIEKRIFIGNNQVPAWNFDLTWGAIVVRNHKDSLYAAFVTGQNLITTSNISASGGIESYNGNTAICLDCRTRGGSNVKPSFW